MNIQDNLDALGITRDTLIIEIKGGMLYDVHNDSNGYVLFDWDTIATEGDLHKEQATLALMLKTLEENES